MKSRGVRHCLYMLAIQQAWSKNPHGSRAGVSAYSHAVLMPGWNLEDA